jgi:hypothetical protein
MTDDRWARFFAGSGELATIWLSITGCELLAVVPNYQR